MVPARIHFGVLALQSDQGERRVLEVGIGDEKQEPVVEELRVENRHTNLPDHDFVGAEADPRDDLDVDDNQKLVDGNDQAGGESIGDEVHVGVPHELVANGLRFEVVGVTLMLLAVALIDSNPVFLQRH